MKVISVEYFTCVKFLCQCIFASFTYRLLLAKVKV